MTAKERECFDLASLGCIPCLILGYQQPPDLHHPLSGGRRIADKVRYPCCPYHHRGVWNDRFPSLKIAQAMCGPSMALEPRRYQLVFGTEQELLERAERELAEKRRLLV